VSKSIALTQGLSAIVDDADYEWLSQWSWYPMHNKYTTYAARCDAESHKTIYMHREITGAQRGQDVDHLNHNGLDNRRCNLRLCTRQQNMRNRRPNRNTTSRYKGVCWSKRAGKWVAALYVNKRRIHLGSFDDEREAALAYNRAAREHFGEYARLNRVEAA
jgi:hypothetical protein